VAFGEPSALRHVAEIVAWPWAPYLNSMVEQVCWNVLAANAGAAAMTLRATANTVRFMGVIFGMG
jgi:hypothetical protein